MNADVILAIDQGTTGTTVVAVDRQLRVVARATREIRQIYPRPGWVEHDLDDIWVSVEGAMASVLAIIDVKRVAAIGITNQRETVGLWDRETSVPLHNAIVWQCRRTADRCEALRAGGHERAIREKTGLLLDPYFSATKMSWLLDEVPGARARAERGEVACGTIDTYLVHRLTGGAVHVTDVSNASRTMLFDLQVASFDAALLDLFGVPREILPSVRSSAEIYGETRGLALLPSGIPIAGMAGDQQAALFGQACFDEGDVKCTYGTGAFILMNTGTEIRRAKNGLLTTVAWKLGPKSPVIFALEGSVFVAGAAVQWLRDGLGIIRSAGEVEVLAKSVSDSGDVVFVPALTGLGAPHWRPHARGMIRGITRGTTAAHIARATLEGIALQCLDVFLAMKREVGSLGNLRVDGGASANDLLMQLEADLMGVDVVRPKFIETTAAGAALLAGLGAGLFSSIDEIRANWREDRRFIPGRSTDVAALREKWNAALALA